ncbi:MAG: flagellar FlbD family protein [Candidatus Korobacteraceae bacterium]
MIQLTRLNNSRLAINSDLIKFVEAAPDTVLTLVSGEKVVVREGVAEVIERVCEFRRSILCGAHPVFRLATENARAVSSQDNVSAESGG